MELSYNSLLDNLKDSFLEYNSRKGEKNAYNVLFPALKKADKFLVNNGIFIFPKVRKQRHIPENQNPDNYLMRLKFSAEKSKNRIWEDNLGLVGMFVRKYRKISCRLECDDIKSWGRIGLLNAIRGFDHTRGVLFSSYASIHIQKTIVRYAIPESLRIIKFHPDFLSNYKKLEYFSMQFQKKFNHTPSNKELADFMGKSTEYVKFLKERKNNLYNLSSLNFPVFAGEEEELIDYVEDEKSSFEEKIIQKIFLLDFLRKNMPKLSRLEKRIILSRLEGKTFEQIGLENNFTRARASEIGKQAVKKSKINRL